MRVRAARLLAQAPRIHRFFLDGWNVFDFTIVALSLLPVAGHFATVARLARLLRALRVVSALPEMRLIVELEAIEAELRKPGSGNG